jgi:uncharacterized RDD family membrane protein YckC
MAEPPAQRPPGGDPLGARILGRGARAAGQLAGATGVDQAFDSAAEEAIVRAIESPAVERALLRLAEEGRLQEVLERAAVSADAEEIARRAIDSEAADRIWEEVLASDKAQRLVERVAEAPEVRAAIAQQGFGLISDIGRQISRVTEGVDDLLERLAHALLRRGDSELETNQVGLVTRAAAFAVDAGLAFGLLSIGAGLLASIAPVASGEIDGLPLPAILGFGLLGLTIAGSLFVLFWSLVGQTPGMRFMGIRLDHDGSSHIGTRTAVLRLFAVPLALLPFGLGYLAILISPRRRGWHDTIAGTDVVYDERGRVAPWAEQRSRRSAASSL